MQHSEDVLNIIKKKLVLEMLQQNHEITDTITAMSMAFAETFCDKFHIEPTRDNLQKFIGDIVFMNGISPIIKELIKADEEAGND
jgi:hypothetical protein